MPQVICLSGTGATGKTSLVEEMLALRPDLFTFSPSIVRGFYAANGIENEIEFRKSLTTSAKRFDFQRRLMTHYLTVLSQLYFACKTPFLLLDRALLDHGGYTLQASGEDLTKDQYDEVMNMIYHRFLFAFQPLVYLLPFPVYWDESNSADGFRHRHFAKDLAVASFIQQFAHHAEHECPVSKGLSGFSPTVFRHVIRREDNPKQRALAVLDHLQREGYC